MSIRLPDYDAFLAVVGEILEATGPEPARLRDEGLLRSAFARPQNAAAYGGAQDAASAAAALSVGIARNHPFVDGNKRAAAAAFAVTLLLNGRRLDATQADLFDTFMALADGRLDDETLSAWGRARVVEDARFQARSQR